MRVLVVKTSSLGDVIHCLPALYDLKQNIPDIKIDFLVEKSFSDVVKSTPLVDNVIEVEFRKWRKKGFLMFIDSEFNGFRKRIKKSRYDVIIDAQGLLKSAYLASLAHGVIVGFDRLSARERLSNLFYSKSYPVDKNQPAIKRLRQLFALAFSYSIDAIDNQEPVFLLDVKKLNKTINKDNSNENNINESYPSIVFLHGTTWDSKLYPVDKWRLLSQVIKDKYPKVNINLLYGNEKERKKAHKIADGLSNINILESMSIASIIKLFSTTSLVISVDTGLAHLSSAMGVPTIGLYGPTNYSLTGINGKNSLIIFSNKYCSPCLKKSCPIIDSEFAPCMWELDNDLLMQFVDDNLKELNR